MSKETGGQAFPKQGWEIDGHNNVLQYQEDGMTLRDYFAAKAMQATLADPACSSWNAEYHARNAYKVAAAMLAVRNGSNSND